MKSQGIVSSNLPLHLAHELIGAAERLSMVRDAGSFLQALKENARLWKKLVLLEPLHGISIPAHFAAFAMELSQANHVVVDDDDVEALIHINRQMSDLIVRGRESGFPCQVGA